MNWFPSRLASWELNRISRNIDYSCCSLKKVKNGPSYTALILNDLEDFLLIQATGESKVSPFGAGIGPRNRLVDEVYDGSKMFMNLSV